MASRLRSRLAVWLHGVACPLLDNTARAWWCHSRATWSSRCPVSPMLRPRSQPQTSIPTFGCSLLAPARKASRASPRSTISRQWSNHGLLQTVQRLAVVGNLESSPPSAGFSGGESQTTSATPSQLVRTPFIYIRVQVHPWRWHCAAGQARFTINPPVDAHHI